VFWRPRELHGRLAPEERWAVRAWCAAGAAGFVLTVVGLVVLGAPVDMASISRIEVPFDARAMVLGALGGRSAVHHEPDRGTRLVPAPASVPASGQQRTACS
jgi:hypothetical protein